MHLVNWVANTILKRKTGQRDALISNMVIPMKADDLSYDTFMWLMQGLMTLFLLVAYIPLLYRTVYRIAFEK